MSWYIVNIMVDKKLAFNLPVLITKQGKRFVAYTHALDISTSGKSEKDAKAKFVELTNLFLEEIAEAGTINDVLAELGWKKTGQKQWTPPQVISSKSIGFKTPVFA
jgi:hypothetical protein